MQFTSQQTVAGGALINYLDVAGSSVRTVVFLHGWRSSSQVWRPVMEQLRGTGLSMIAVDLPGFGRSETPAAWTIGDYVKAMSEFIVVLKRGPAVIVGHSFGGRIGIRLAAEYPDLVSHLILVDSAGLRPDTTGVAAKRLLAKTVRPLFKPRMMSRLRRRIYAAIGADDAIATPELQATYRNIIAEDLTSVLSRVQRPTLIVWGNNDTETPLTDGQTIAKAIPNARLEILSPAGHFSFLDQRDAFCRAVTTFLHVSPERPS